MILLEKTEVWGWEHAIRGMRNPMNSWERSDSSYVPDINVGDNDRDLMTRLIRGGSCHRKFLRQIFVSVDITAPMYWWLEFDTYKVGTASNSCSKMHKIAAKEFVPEDFSIEHLSVCDMADSNGYLIRASIPRGIMSDIIGCLNYCREKYLAEENPVKKKMYWWQMIQLLPESYNQKRTVTITYENLLNMLEYRRGHKLDEWRQFCDWILTLPYGDLLKEGINEQGATAKGGETGSPGK